MPAFMKLGDMKGEVTEASAASASSDPEYKYVNVRRLSRTEEDEGEVAPQPGLTAEDGSDTQAILDKILEIDGVEGESANASMSGSGDTINDFGGDVIAGLSAAGTGPAGGVSPRSGFDPGGDYIGSGFDRGHLGPRSGFDPGGDYTGSGFDRGHMSLPAVEGLAAEEDAAAAIIHAKTVLAWARTDGVSPATGDGPAGGDQHDMVALDSFSWAAVGSSSGWRSYRVSVDTIEARAFDGQFQGGVTVPAGDVGPGRPGENLSLNFEEIKAVTSAAELDVAASGYVDGSVRFQTDGLDLF